MNWGYLIKNSKSWEVEQGVEEDNRVAEVDLNAEITGFERNKAYEY